MAKEKEHSFEETVRELEQVVRRLESGELSLDDSLKAFEQGVQLARSCEEKLTQAKSKVEVLVKQAGEYKLQAFSTEDMEA